MSLLMLVPLLLLATGDLLLATYFYLHPSGSHSKEPFVESSLCSCKAVINTSLKPRRDLLQRSPGRITHASHRSSHYSTTGTYFQHISPYPSPTQHFKVHFELSESPHHSTKCL
jgi:hypothetical protein